MRLPGTRYQEHGWEQVRKLLGQCSLQALIHGPLLQLPAPHALAGALDEYVEAMAAQLRASARSVRGEAPGNSYGESVFELSLGLLCELQAHPGHWHAFAAAVASEQARAGPFWHGATGEAVLRKKVNDMFAVLRDKVDADNYQVACGRPCSPNKMYAYRMLDTAYAEVARIFGAWQENPSQVAAILEHPVAGIPIEVRQMKSIAHCRPQWIMRWSETREQFGGGPGPLHTRSKRFASLKTSPEKIAAMLREIGDYEELSSNRDSDWLGDASTAAGWLDDVWRVLAEGGGDDDGAGAGRILAPCIDGFEGAHAGAESGDDAESGAGAQSEDDGDGALAPPLPPAPPVPPSDARDMQIAASVSLPPRYIELASLAQDRASWAARSMAESTLPVRLAVFLKMLGAFDDSYPSEWLDPATGELPTMEQLAALDRVSLPTLRKRRNAAIALLQAALPP
ncbi:MAG: hypothetical protein V4582_15440 [Pseudomonadota bacterium]